VSYVQQTLASEEQILHRANFNWTYSFFPVLWFLLGAACPGFFFYLQYIENVPAGDLRVGWWIAIIAFAAGTFILAGQIIYLMTTEIVVTTYRFVYKRGLIARNTKEVSLNKIEEITLHQSIWGRLFGYGKLVLRGTGVGVIELPDLDNPITLRRIIENARSTLRSGTRDADNDD
jgi:uncharacterized membrane protein YdbT with pleckstrin-like domain